VTTPETAATLDDHPRGGELFLRRLRILCALAVAAAIFWHVGWWAVKPVDPQGPISLLLVDQGVVTMAQLLGLAIVTSGLAVAICGAGSGDRGPLAIAVGLATLGLRGAQLDRLVLYRLTVSPAPGASVDPFPTWSLIAECWLWLALIAVGFVAGRWVESWFANERGRDRAGGILSRNPADVRYGIGVTIVTGLVAWAIFSHAIGDGVAPILKGQVYFSVGLAFLVGALVARACFRVSAAVWAIVAIPLVVVVAYLVGGPSAASVLAACKAGTYLNISAVARPLPVEFAALGAVGVLLEPDARSFLHALFGFSSSEKPQSAIPAQR